jgi:hypothetical protein
MDYPVTPLADSPLRTTIRDVQAQGFFIKCQLTGAIIGYSHQGADWVKHWAWTDEDNTAPTMTAGLTVEPEVRTFRIPRQDASATDGTTAFAGAVSENDLIAWNGKIYIVDRPWTMDFYEGVFNMTGTAREVRRAGP